MNLAQLAFSLLLPVTTVYAELQLTSQPTSYELDGVKLSRLAFADGKETVNYTPPRGWECSGGGAQLMLAPKDYKQAQATISKIAVPEQAQFDDETCKGLTRQVLASVPSGSSNVQLVSQEMNPLLINKKETFLVTISYTLYGDTYGRSVMFVNRGKEQLRFQLISRLADFPTLENAFLRSHYSWQNL